MNLFYSTRNILDFGGIIVNAANENLRHGSGVCGAIFDKAGYGLDIECEHIRYVKRKKKIPTGSCVLTSGHNCFAAYILHAVGPIYPMYTPKEASRLLAKTYWNSMICAKNMKMIIAFPAISCGVYSFPIPSACEIAVNTLKVWSYMNPTHTPDIVLTAFDPAVKNEYVKLGVAELV